MTRAPMPRIGLALLALLLPAGLGAQTRPATLVGQVLDAESRVPVAGVEVILLRTTARAETDSAGGFRLAGLVPELATVQLRRIGYRFVERNVTLYPGRTTTVEYLMTREATELPEVEVVERPDENAGPAALAGFEERRRLGGGVFLDAEALSRYETRRMADVLRGTSGVRLVVDGQSAYAASNRQPIRSIRTGPGLPCYLDIIVDGQLYWSMTRDGARPPSINGIAAVAELAGIEIYNSTAAIPLKYRSIGNACGAILLWSKRGDPGRKEGAG